MAEPAENLAPDELSLRSDLRAARFLAGEDRGRWKLRKIVWPKVFIDVFARDGVAYSLRLDVSEYPATAPTGSFWDPETDKLLAFARWPQGGERIRLAFRTDWKDGTALYIPCDRLSIVGHDGWLTQYPQLLWDPRKGITKYLEVVQDLLHSKDYRCRNA